MNRRIAGLLALTFLLTNIAVFAKNDAVSARSRVNVELVSLLPASDGVIVVDLHQVFAQALPRFLAGNKKVLDNVNRKIEAFQAQTGIDARKFDSAAIGIAVSVGENSKPNVEPTMILRGDIDTAALFTAAKPTVDKIGRTETEGSYTIFVVPMDEKKTSADPAGDAFTSGLDKEAAFAGIDRNTIVIGSLASVHQTLSRQTSVSPDITALLSVRPDTVASFAMRTPAGVAKFLPLDNDMIGKDLDDLRYISGSADITPAGLDVATLARFQNAARAQSFKTTLAGLKDLGKAFLSGSKRADQRLYGKLIGNANISLTGTDVALTLSLAQADINTLVAEIKAPN